MSIIGWVVLGAIAGWLASIVTGRNRQMGCIANIVAGIIGGWWVVLSSASWVARPSRDLTCIVYWWHSSAR